MIVDNVVLLELKAVEKLADVHSAQLLNYLKSTNIEVVLLLNLVHKLSSAEKSTIILGKVH